MSEHGAKRENAASRDEVRSIAVAFMQRTYTSRVEIARSLGIADDLPLPTQEASLEILRRVREGGLVGALRSALGIAVAAAPVSDSQSSPTPNENEWVDVVRTLLNGMNKADLEWAIPFVRGALGPTGSFVLGEECAPASQSTPHLRSDLTEGIELVWAFVGDLEEAVGQLRYDDDVKQAVIDAGEDCTVELSRVVRSLASQRDAGHRVATNLAEALRELEQVSPQYGMEARRSVRDACKRARAALSEYETHQERRENA